MPSSPNFQNLDLRMFHSQLADKVRALNGCRCPCCGHPMVRPRRKSEQNQRRRDRESVAHDIPTGFGGDPTIWVYACQGCNGDQKGRSFESWSRMLGRLGDERAVRVAALAVIVNEFIKEKHRG